MSDSIWACRFCNHINDWGEHVCSLCGRSSYESAEEFLRPLLPTNKQDELTTLRAKLAEAKSERANYGDIMTSKLGTAEAENRALWELLCHPIVTHADTKCYDRQKVNALLRGSKAEKGGE